MSVVEVGEEMKGVTDPLALHLWGILCAHEGRYYEAEGAFLGAVEAEPEMVGSYVELGLVYACRGEYPKMVEALRRALGVGAGGVRAYMGERPLGDVPTDVTACTKADGEGVPSLITAMSYLAEGRDEEAAGMLEQVLEGQPVNPPAAMMLLTLAYLLQGEGVEADDAGIRRAAAAAGGLAGRC